MRSRSDPDRIHVVFHDHRLVANAGLLLPASLALRLGLGELVDRYVDLGDTPAAPAIHASRPGCSHPRSSHSRSSRSAIHLGLVAKSRASRHAIPRNQGFRMPSNCT